MSAEIVEVDLVGERQQRVRRILGRCVRDALEGWDGDIGGFALITWDMRGEARTAVFDDLGPIGRSLVPAFVHDALNRHLAVAIMQENGGPGKITGGA